MVESKKHEVKELKRELKRIDQVGKEECVLCRFVLVFSSVVLLLIILFVFFMRLDPGAGGLPPAQPEEPFRSLPATPADFASTSLEYNQRILELGQTIRNAGVNTSTGAPITPSSAGQGSTTVVPAPTSSQKAPEGPPPVMAP